MRGHRASSIIWDEDWKIKMRINIINCSACGKNHEGLELTKLDGEGFLVGESEKAILYKYRATCPNCDNTILVSEDSDE